MTDTALPYAEYASITDAPHDKRRLNDVPLSVAQMNWINRRAYELRTTQVAADRTTPEGVFVKGGEFYVEDAKAAREEFKALHETVDGQWVALPKEVN